MIGLDYQRRLSQLLSESVGSYWVDQKSGFDYLYEASRDFSKEVKAFHNTAELLKKNIVVKSDQPLERL